MNDQPAPTEEGSSQASWTESDKWKARVSPFLILKKLDRIIDERVVVDESADWQSRLFDNAEQEAAFRLAQKETARIERLEDKLNRQQPLATLLVTFSTGLLVAAWLRAEWVVAALCLLALGVAALALITSSRANHFFREHTLTTSDLQRIINAPGSSAQTLAARAIIDTQKNVPYQSKIGNRNEATRHALNIALGALVAAALIFAIPNWGSENEDATAKLRQRMHQSELEIRKLRQKVGADQAGARKQRQRLRRLETEIGRLRRHLSQQR